MFLDARVFVVEDLGICILADIAFLVPCISCNLLDIIDLILSPIKKQNFDPTY